MTPGGDAKSKLTSSNKQPKPISTDKSKLWGVCSRQCASIMKLCVDHNQVDNNKNTAEDCRSGKDKKCHICLKNIVKHLDSKSEKAEVGYNGANFEDKESEIGVSPYSQTAYNNKHFPRLLNHLLVQNKKEATNEQTEVVTWLSGHSNHWKMAIKNFANDDGDCPKAKKHKMLNGAVMAIKIQKNSEGLWKIVNCELVIGGFEEKG